LVEEKIKQAVDVLSKCNYVIALSGAGISTESGIPDFRSPVSGLWSNADPEDFTIERFRVYPQALYQVGADLFQIITGAQPNEAHKALGELENKGLIKTVITQNIDALHQKGDSRNVLEIHGSLNGASCIHCSHEEPMEKILQDVQEAIIPPRCIECGEPMKPNVILFGEAMPPAFQLALNESRKADGMLVVGSSLVVSPANMLPDYVDNLVIVNRESTPLDDSAQVVVHGSLSDIMPYLKDEWISRQAS